MVLVDGRQVPLDGGELARDVGQVGGVAGDGGHIGWQRTQTVQRAVLPKAFQIGRVREHRVVGAFQAKLEVAGDVVSRGGKLRAQGLRLVGNSGEFDAHKDKSNRKKIRYYK